MGHDPSITWVFRAGRGSRGLLAEIGFPALWLFASATRHFLINSLELRTQFRYANGTKRTNCGVVVLRDEFGHDDRELLEQFKSALRRGEIRSAEIDSEGNWHANTWVKQGILLGFRRQWSKCRSRPKHLCSSTRKPTRRGRCRSKRRAADQPGGSTVRDGSYVAPGVVMDAAVLRQCWGLR